MAIRANLDAHRTDTVVIFSRIHFLSTFLHFGCLFTNMADESENLEAYAKILTDLSTNPYDLALHAQHIKLTALPGLQDEANSAREMLTGFWPAGDDVWIPLLESKTAEGAESPDSALSVLALFEVAEDDYLCTSISDMCVFHDLSILVSNTSSPEAFGFLGGTSCETSGSYR